MDLLTCLGLSLIPLQHRLHFFFWYVNISSLTSVIHPHRGRLLHRHFGHDRLICKYLQFPIFGPVQLASRPYLTWNDRTYYTCIVEVMERAEGM